MPNNDLLSAALGLVAAISWGIGDFCGGLASKRTTTFGVVILSQAVGLLLLLALALSLREPVPSTASLAWGAGAGVMGGLAVTALYRALAGGQMGIAAPITAVLGAALPVLFGVAIQGAPSPLQLAGLFVALVGVALLSLSGGKGAPRSLGLAVFAGLGIGAFLILLRQAGTTALFWPLVAARVASVTTIFAGTLAARQPWRPDRKWLPVIALAGLMDLGGNAFFILATQTGRLDIAAVLSSLYPAATVLLAGIVLKERVSGVQGIGIVAVLIAIGLIVS